MEIMVLLGEVNNVFFEVIDEMVDVSQHLLSFSAGFAPGVRLSHVVIPGVELDLSEGSPELEQFSVRCIVILEQHLSAGAV